MYGKSLIFHEIHTRVIKMKCKFQVLLGITNQPNSQLFLGKNKQNLKIKISFKDYLSRFDQY